MSEWHSEWQNQFPAKNQEVVVELDGEKHRADVMACGYVIEFQHSPIAAEEFEERNNFYLRYGKKVIWVFDFAKEFSEKQIKFYDQWSTGYDNGGQFKWSYAKRFLQSFLPQKNKNIIVFFQFFASDHSNEEESYMERVVWAIEENGLSNFSRFRTSYYPANAKELLECVKKREL
jgi:competence CoiA-like predicted nuclease